MLTRLFPADTAGNGTLTPGDMLCTKQYTPVCTKNATATGSTCDGLANAWNITKDNFVQYNDGINDSCDDLVSGNPVRLQCCSKISLLFDC